MITLHLKKKPAALSALLRETGATLDLTEGEGEWVARFDHCDVVGVTQDGCTAVKPALEGRAIGLQDSIDDLLRQAEGCWIYPRVAGFERTRVIHVRADAALLDEVAALMEERDRETYDPRR